MPTDLIATRSQLSSRTKQLAVAGNQCSQQARSDNGVDAFRIEIAVVIEVPAGSLDANLAGSIAVRVSRA